MKKQLSLFLLIFGMASVAEAASTVQRVAYFGILDPGATDNLNSFGTGTDLSGQAIRLDFVISDAGQDILPAFTTATQAYTGLGNGSFTVTIGGVAKTAPAEFLFVPGVGSATNSFFSKSIFGSVDLVETSIDNPPLEFELLGGNLRYHYFSANVLTYAAPGTLQSLDFDVPFDFVPAPDPRNFGNFSLINIPQFFGSGEAILASGTFQVTRVFVPSVPEPGTWALMVAGFGMVGGAIRRRRRASLSEPVPEPA